MNVHLSFLECDRLFQRALGVAMLAMHTMIPLRITGIAHNVVSILFGFFTGIYPMLVQHSILLPVNIAAPVPDAPADHEVKAASAGNHSMDWLKPFTQQRKLKAGETLFGAATWPTACIFVVSGQVRLQEMRLLLNPGAMVGELGFLSPDKERTQTVECDRGSDGADHRL